MAIRMADLPQTERPRERLSRLGAGRLSDRELIALVLGTGGRGTSALDLATNLVAERGCLFELSRARTEELSEVASMGTSKASALVAAFELGRRAAVPFDERKAIGGPGDLAALATAEFSDLRVEQVVVIVLSKSNKPLKVIRLTGGCMDSCLMPARDVLAAVLRKGSRVRRRSQPSIGRCGPKSSRHSSHQGVVLRRSCCWANFR